MFPSQPSTKQTLKAGFPSAHCRSVTCGSGALWSPAWGKQANPCDIACDRDRNLYFHGNQNHDRCEQAFQRRRKCLPGSLSNCIISDFHVIYVVRFHPPLSIKLSATQRLLSLSQLQLLPNKLNYSFSKIRTLIDNCRWYLSTFKTTTIP